MSERIFLGREHHDDMFGRILREEIDAEVMNEVLAQAGYEKVEAKRPKVDAPVKIRLKLETLLPLGFHLQTEKDEATTRFYAVAPSDMPFEDFALYKLKYS